MRLIGVFNAAIWLGGVVFFTVVASPALGSSAMGTLLQPRNMPYFAPGIQHVLLGYYFQFFVVCALIALIHLTLEWLYLGRPKSRKLPLIVLLGLLGYGIVGSNMIQPHLKTTHAIRFSAKAKPVERDAAARSVGRWHVVVLLAQCGAIACLAVHFWRLANPSDTPRFVSSVKFRG